MSLIKTNKISNVLFLIFTTVSLWGILGYLLIEKNIEKEALYAKLINLSGKQRMLSQKTTLLATRLHDTQDQDPILVDDAKKIQITMQEEFQFIISNLPSENMHKIYFEHPDNLAQKEQNYFGLLTQYYETKDLLVLKALQNYSFNLLPLLNKAVYQFEEEAKIHAQSVKEKGFYLLIGALVTLIIEFFLFLLPLVKKQKEYEEKLSDEKNRYLKLLENASDAIHIMDFSGRVIYANEAFYDLLGLPKNYQKQLQIQDWDTSLEIEVKDRIEKLLQNKSIFFNAVFKKADDTLIKVQVHANKINIASIEYMHASARDLSKTEEYEQLKFLNANFALSQKIAKIGSWKHNVQTDRYWCSQEYLEIFELEDIDMDRLTLAHLISYIHKDDLAGLIKVIEQTHLQDDIHHFQYRIVTPSNTTKYVEIYWQNEFDENGVALYSSGTLQDITDKAILAEEAKQKTYQLQIQLRQNEEMNDDLEETNRLLENKTLELHKYQEDLENIVANQTQEIILSKNKYQNLLQFATEGVFILSPTTGELIEYSKEVKRLLRYDDQELKRLTVFDWDKGIKDLDEYQNITSLIGQTPILLERIHTRKDGSTYLASILASKITINGVEYFYASVRDITTERENELLIQKQKEEFETIFNNARDPLAILDLESNFLDCNQAYLDLIGLPKEEVLQLSCIGLSIEEDRPRAQKAIEETIKKGFVKDFEKSCYTHGNDFITVNISFALMPDNQRIISSIKDITELIKRNEMILHNTKMIAIGEMIGNIAHQWRQPLTIISTIASGIAFKHTLGRFDDSQLPKNMDEIVHQAMYLSKTIDDFRDFIKGDKVETQITLSNLFDKVISLASPNLKSKYIEVITNIDNSFVIDGYENELLQALINIINNSIDALSQDLTLQNRYIFIDIDEHKDEDIIITIKDNGGGIDEEIIHRIFNPYFTTKHKSQGTGLGLSMTYKIITELHKGSIFASNMSYIYNEQEYKGASFTIRLPKNIGL